MVVCGFLSCLYVLCVVALLTVWSVRGECVFFFFLVSCIFYVVHVEYIRLYGPMKILFLFVYALITRIL
jgi:hypothetical protein